MFDELSTRPSISSDMLYMPLTSPSKSCCTLTANSGAITFSGIPSAFAEVIVRPGSAAARAFHSASWSATAELSFSKSSDRMTSNASALSGMALLACPPSMEAISKGTPASTIPSRTASRT